MTTRVIGWIQSRVTEDALPPTLLFIALASLALCMPPHNDTWWHLRSGLEMARAGEILTAERLSHTVQGTALYHNHEWLTQLLFYGLFTVGGPPLLAVASAACAMTAVWGAWRLVHGSAEARFGWLALLLAGTTLAWAIRPQVLSLLLFVVALHLATSDRDRWLPVLCVIWANFHAVAVTGVVVAACAAADAVVMERQRARRSLLILLACVLVMTVTPLGWYYWPRVVEVVRLARALGINEYRSPLELAQLPFWVSVLALIGLAVRSGPLPWQSRRTRILVLVAGVFAVAGALSIRNIPMFVLAAVPAMSRLLPPPRRRAVPRPLSPTSLALAAGVTVVAAAGVAIAWREHGARLGWVPMSPAAVDAVRGCNGPIFNGFADGGVLTWFVPERKVFVDSRGVEAYPLELLLRSREADLHGQYRELFEEFQIRCAVVEANSVMAHALAADPAMQEAYADATWRVFSRPTRD